MPERLPLIDWTPELYREWLATFDSGKQKVMQRTYEKFGLENMRDFTAKSIFTKIEALVKDHNTVAGRLIYKSSDVNNLILGPVMMVAVKRLVALGNVHPELGERPLLDTVNFQMAYAQDTPSIVQHLTEIGAATFIEADFSANDKTQTKEVSMITGEALRRLGMSQTLVRYHQACNNIPLVADNYGLKVTIHNQLPTGAVDTTFRNSLWNLILLHSFCRRHRLRGVRACILGDDMLASLRQRKVSIARKYTAHCRRAHMDAKTTSFRWLAQGHFLSKHFYPTHRGDNTHAMMPFLGKVLAKFNCRPNTNQAVDNDMYMAGKALSAAYEFRFCHELRDLFFDRADYHLDFTGGRYSLEGVSFHQRIVYYRDIETHMRGEVEFPDLITQEELSDFWQAKAGLSWMDIEPSARAIIGAHVPGQLDHEALQQLVDF